MTWTARCWLSSPSPAARCAAAPPPALSARSQPDTLRSLFSPQGAVADAALCAALLLGCVKGSRLGDAGSVTEYLASRGARIPLKDFTAMLQALPQRTPEADALAFMDALEPCVAFRDGPGHSYFRHFARLLVREFCAECAGAYDRIARRPADALQAAGLALLDVRASALPKGGQVALTSARPGVDLAGAARDGFQKGDFLLLTPVHPAQYGAAYGGMGAGGAPAGEGVEAEVITVVPQLTVRLLTAGAAGLGGAAGEALVAPGVLLRADKLANRVTAARQLEALRVFAEADVGSSRAPGVDARLRAIVVGDGGEAGAAGIPALCDAPAEGHGNAARRAAVAAHAAALPGVNASQRAALGAGLARTLTLVQGCVRAGARRCLRALSHLHIC